MPPSPSQAGEQEFFAAKGFTNKPTVCPDCRAARKSQRGGGGGGSYSGGGGGGGGYGAGGGRPAREMFQATCSGCARLPRFRSSRGATSPLYCRDCFAQRQSYR